ncbi:MAG: hypothetical protein EAX96_02950 [Candidatus Lokiarchaeota archaeon]|nr:hypothetical protein [Candidatus Lokiarchaeota archaeon]
MDNLVKNLQEKVFLLRKEKQELEDKIVNLLTRSTVQHLVNLPNQFDLHNKLLELIESAKKELLIITPSFDQDFAHIIIKKWKELQQNLLLITLDRHLIFNSDNIKGYDFLISTNTLEIVNNPDINSTFIIIDRKQVIVLTTNLNKNEITKKFSIGVIFDEEQVATKFFKFFNEHLPTFMQIN